MSGCNLKLLRTMLPTPFVRQPATPCADCRHPTRPHWVRVLLRRSGRVCRVSCMNSRSMNTMRGAMSMNRNWLVTSAGSVRRASVGGSSAPCVTIPPSPSASRGHVRTTADCEVAHETSSCRQTAATSCADLACRRNLVHRGWEPQPASGRSAWLALVDRAGAKSDSPTLTALTRLTG